MSELAGALQALEDALDALAEAARRLEGGAGDGEALRALEAERDALAERLEAAQAERAKDAAMIEEALADLRSMA